MNTQHSAASVFEELKSDAGHDAIADKGSNTTPDTVVVELFGTDRCHGTQFCKTALEARNVEYVFRNLDSDVEAIEVLRALDASSPSNVPAIRIGKAYLQSPTLTELDKALERHGVVPMRLYHSHHKKRYFIYMPEGEAYIAYQDAMGVRSLEHTFVPSADRNAGIGQKLVVKTLRRLCRDGQKTRFKCEFINYVAKKTRLEAVEHLQKQARLEAEQEHI